MTIKRIILVLVALSIFASMIRLGFWQLDRAEQKKTWLLVKQQQSALPSIELVDLVEGVGNGGSGLTQSRYRSISITGSYDGSKTIFVDNQVLNSKVGYLVFTPFLIEGTNYSVLINRGWVPIGESRDVLPTIITPAKRIQLQGRLNVSPQQPPLWRDEYAVVNGAVWQFLPIDKFATEMELNLLPMVVELAPHYVSETSSQFERQWANIDDKWVGKHKAYALQWFSMAAVFLIACFIVARRPSLGGSS